jgi:hypothetical protein
VVAAVGVVAMEAAAAAAAAVSTSRVLEEVAVLVGMEAAVAATWVAAWAAAPADAEASSLGPVLAALPVEAAEVAPDPAGYGRQLGGGSTAVGLALSQRVRHLLSRRSKSRTERRLRRQLMRVPRANV